MSKRVDKLPEYKIDSIRTFLSTIAERYDQNIAFRVASECMEVWATKDGEKIQRIPLRLTNLKIRRDSFLQVQADRAEFDGILNEIGQRLAEEGSGFEEELKQTTLSSSNLAHEKVRYRTYIHRDLSYEEVQNELVQDFGLSKLVEQLDIAEAREVAEESDDDQAAWMIENLIAEIKRLR